MRLVITALALLLLLPGLAPAQPRIELSPAQLDLGTMKQFETRELQVTISNTGDEVLEIRDIETTCGCTVPELAVDELAPGASAVMDIHFNSKTFQGPQRKYIHIYSNDPVQGASDLIITADIKVPLSMEPGQAMIRFRTLQVGETQTMTYTFHSEEVPRLELAPRSWPESLLDIEVKPGSDPQTVLVEFVIRTDAPPGRHREVIKLTSNVPAVPVVSLQADVKLVSDLVVNPERVNLRMVRPEQTLRTVVRVAPYRPGTSFEVTSVEIDIPGLIASVQNSDSESVITLSGQSVAADNELVAANGAVKGTLTIRTTLASVPETTVPVMYMVRR